MSSSNSENETTTIGNRVKNLNLGDRPRIAKKSTAPAQEPISKYANMTKRQAALASKDKSKQDLAKLSSAESIDVDDATSGREKRRKSKRVPGAAYDSSGIHLSGFDLCDCLQETCPGCHFKCPSCSSQKCGAECRVNRKYIYEQVEYHGYEFSVKNPLLK